VIETAPNLAKRDFVPNQCNSAHGNNHAPTFLISEYHMSDDKQQKFTSKVRRGLVWVHAQAIGELTRLKDTAGGSRISGLSAGALADVEAAILWIEQNKEATPS
jgi:hypothetical protein